LNIEMGYQYKNGEKTSCTATGIRAQHVTDHKNFRQHTGISVTHKMSDLESSSLYVKVKNGKFSVCTPLRSRGGVEVSHFSVCTPFRSRGGVEVSHLLP
jgi:hypothetical protein